MTDRGPITRERFAQLLDAYGAEPARWPDAERTAAQALLASDADAQRMHAQALVFDQLLDGAVAPEPSAALRRAVAEIPLRAQRSPVQLPWLLGSALRSAFAAAFVLGLGVLAGTSSSADSLLSGTAVSATQVGGDDQRAVPADTANASVAQSEDPLDTLFELAFNSAVGDDSSAEQAQ